MKNFNIYILKFLDPSDGMYMLSYKQETQAQAEVDAKLRAKQTKDKEKKEYQILLDMFY